MEYRYEYEYPMGIITIAETDGCVTHVIASAAKQSILPNHERREAPLIKKAAKQLAEYFAGRRREFDLPLSFGAGTSFQKQVWAALLEIPYGETRTYGEIAAQIKNPKASRAVGGANNKNPIAIICPCHRVIGADGSLTGYASGLANKQFLLDIERNYK